MKTSYKSVLIRTPLFQNAPNLNLHDYYHFPDFQSFSLELMSYTDRLRSIALAFLITGLLAICTTLSFELWQTNALVTTENSLLEIGQGSFLILAAIIQGARTFSANVSSLERDISIGLSLFALALFLREVDIDKLGASAAWDVLEKFLRVVTLLLFLGFIAHMSRRIKLVFSNLGKILLAPTVIISMIACVFYACGWPFDKELFNIDKSLSLWFEETFELNACLLFLCAGLAGNIKTDEVKIQAPSF